MPLQIIFATDQINLLNLSSNSNELKSIIENQIQLVLKNLKKEKQNLYEHFLAEIFLTSKL
jgi:hypothetical protein